MFCFLLPNPPFDDEKEEAAYREDVRSFRAAKSEDYGKNWDNKDRVVVAVSSLALGFSLAFLTDHAKDADPVWPLYLGWALFAVSIVTVILSFEFNAWQLRRTIRKIDDWIENGEPNTKPESGVLFLFRRWGDGRVRVVDWVNSMSVWTLIAGLAATVGFVIGNS